MRHYRPFRHLTAAMGIPTLDGIGPAGDFAHTDREYILKESYSETIRLFALWPPA
ncbi:MAG: hypothetical protein P8X90_19595 [Desulfobacterales bacterium]